MNKNNSLLANCPFNTDPDVASTDGAVCVVSGRVGARDLHVDSWTSGRCATADTTASFLNLCPNPFDDIIGELPFRRPAGAFQLKIYHHRYCTKWTSLWLTEKY